MLVMTAKQYIGHTHSFYIFWSCVLRIFQQGFSTLWTITFILSTLFVMNHLRKKSCSRFYHHHGRDFTTKRHKLTQREFVKILSKHLFSSKFDAMVYSLISSTHKNNIVIRFRSILSDALRKIGRRWLRKHKRTRRWGDMMHNRFYRIDNRLSFHQQSYSSSIDLIIYLTMRIGTKISWIDILYVNQSFFDRFCKKRGSKKRAKYFRKNTHDMIAHGQLKKVKDKKTTQKLYE